MNCVVIPIHKEFDILTISEKKSLVRILQIFQNENICFIYPADLNIFNYNKICISTSSTNISFVKLDNKYFKDVQKYSDLLVSLFFYKIFKKYEYILICQLDTYVFRNELALWCSKNYDYIGAPWFEIINGDLSLEFKGVGNGGFSLRKVKKIISILKRVRIIKHLDYFNRKIFNNFFNYKALLLSTNFYFKIKNTWNLELLFYKDYLPEDQYFGTFINSIFVDFNLPDFHDSYKFSFETNPGYLYNINQSQLPFGCHAWEKYDKIFWDNHIE